MNARVVAMSMLLAALGQISPLLEATDGWNRER
jgi:hypothetical protein